MDRLYAMQLHKDMVYAKCTKYNISVKRIYWTKMDDRTDFAGYQIQSSILQRYLKLKLKAIIQTDFSVKCHEN